MTETYKFADNIALTELDSELVLLNLDNGEYFALNTTGALIAKLVNQGLSLAEAGKQIAEKFSIELDRAQSDVSELIGQLMEQQLLVKRLDD